MLKHLTALLAALFFVLPAYGADVSAACKDWSATSNSNNPSGSTTIGTGLDDNLREIQGSVVRCLSYKGADIASAATTDLGAIEGLAHAITGTTTITSFGTVRAGIWKVLIFSGSLTLTHNATSLILPGGANITTAAGDVAMAMSEGSGNWRVHWYTQAAVGFSTGDVKVTIKTTADTGWVLMNDGTIGSATSGGTTRANADTSALYSLLWTNCANADCAVSTGRGASAAADFAANKTIALPKALGRSLATYGAGSGLTSRALGSIVGEETHTLSTAEMPAHTHAGVMRSGSGANIAGSVGQSTDGAGSTDSTGGGGSHNVLDPRVHLNVMIKL